MNEQLRGHVADLLTRSGVHEPETDGRGRGAYRSTRVLDLACGDGSFTQILHEVLGSYDHLVGMDIDARLLEEARDRFADAYVGDELPVHFVFGDAREIRYSDGAFDLVSISNGLHHVANVASGLAEMLRVLRPGGALLVHEMVSDALSEAQETARDVHHFKAWIDRAYGVSHRPTYTRAEIDSFMQTLPVEVIDRREYVPMDDDGAAADRVEERVEFVEDYAELARDLPFYPVVRKEVSRLTHRLRTVGFAYPPQILLAFRKDGAKV
ncbi:MAG: methyltransferase domain-containing protein [Spirochaetes bacterium]|jgi:SAM-dependent methyltransferase|nr:methyltransferase domain-containing protein [Spirochaetota bacterium]